jgi:hypothetical protein
VAREVVEASVFWRGDLFAVKYFALGERVFFDDVPKAEGIEVRERVVEAAPKTPRNRWDLPLGAIALTAACMNAMVVGSSVRNQETALGTHVAVVHSERLVEPDEEPVLEFAAGIGVRGVPEQVAETEDDAAEAKPIDVFGDTGLVHLLAQYQGDGRIAVPWAPAAHEPGALWGDRIDDVWGVAGIGLSGIGEGGGGNALGNYVVDHVYTEPLENYRHATLTGHHTSPVCHLPGTAAITCNRMPPEIIQRIVHLNEGRFRACYADGLKRNPTLAGRVVTKFAIARDGSVSAASDGGSDLGDPQVVSCVTRAFMGLEFPENPEGIATVTYPIVMSPSD